MVFQVKVGGSVIAPTADTTLAPGAVVKGDHEFAFTPSVEYFFGDTPFQLRFCLLTHIHHDVLLDGEKVASVRQLPPTITAKYNFKNSTDLLHILVLVVQPSLHGTKRHG